MPFTQFAPFQTLSKSLSFQPSLPSSSTPSPTAVSTSTQSSPPSNKTHSETASLVVIGSLAIDISMIPTSSSPLQTTSPGRVLLSLGGVGGNVASAAYSIGIEDTLLIAGIGDDLMGNVAKSGLEKRGMRIDGLLLEEESSSRMREGEEKTGRTATCGYLLDEKGELIGGVADMEIASKLSETRIVEKLENVKPKMVIMDGNLLAGLIRAVLDHCRENGIQTLFEPTSNVQSLKILQALSEPFSEPSVVDDSPPLTCITPNIHELTTLYEAVVSSSYKTHWEAGKWFDFITLPHQLLSKNLPSWITNEGIVQMAVRLLPLMGSIIVKSGSRGVVVIQRISGRDLVDEWKKKQGKNVVVAACTKTGREAVVVQYFEAIRLEEGNIISVTGAGDSLAGALGAMMSRGLELMKVKDLEKMVDAAQKAAVETLRSSDAVGDLTNLRTLLPASSSESP